MPVSKECIFAAERVAAQGNYGYKESILNPARFI